MHTYSIIALDRESGLMGVAVQSHWFSVGSIVSWAEAGVGVVASQAFAEPSYGPLGISLMKGGKKADEALTALLNSDKDKESRQVAMLDIDGNVSAFTGSLCIPEAGHVVGDGVSAQGNIMRTNEVWHAMLRAYMESEDDFPERLISSLEAGEKAGGDIRGRQSAAMLVVKVKPLGPPWKNKVVDLRVDDSPDPLKEMRRLLRINRAYSHADKGDELITQGKVEAALSEYREASKLAPDIEELAFWEAVTLLNCGREDEALPILKKVFMVRKEWKIVLASLPSKGLLKIDQPKLSSILNMEL